MLFKKLGKGRNNTLQYLSLLTLRAGKSKDLVSATSDKRSVIPTQTDPHPSHSHKCLPSQTSSSSFPRMRPRLMISLVSLRKKSEKHFSHTLPTTNIFTLVSICFQSHKLSTSKCKASHLTCPREPILSLGKGIFFLFPFSRKVIQQFFSFPFFIIISFL